MQSARHRAELAGKGNGEILKRIGENAPNQRAPWKIDAWSAFRLSPQIIPGQTNRPLLFP